MGNSTNCTVSSQFIHNSLSLNHAILLIVLSLDRLVRLCIVHVPIYSLIPPWKRTCKMSTWCDATWIIGIHTYVAFVNFRIEFKQFHYNNIFFILFFYKQTVLLLLANIHTRYQNTWRIKKEIVFKINCFWNIFIVWVPSHYLESCRVIR